MPRFPIVEGMARRTTAYRGLAQASRLRVLDAVMTHPGAPLSTLVEETGLHENTLRDHLRILESEGFVRSERDHRGTRGRPRAVYRATTPDDVDAVAEERIAAAATRGELLRRLVPEARTALPAAAAHQVDALYEHLDELGLDPEVDERALQVELAPCAFQSLVDDTRDIICDVHATLIRDVLVRAGGPVALGDIEPYRTPQTCRVHLVLRGSEGAPDPTQ